MEPEDVDAIIEAQAAEPEDATIDGNRVKNRSISDLLKLRDHAQAQSAGSAWGRSMARVRLPDALGPSSTSTE